MGVLQGLVGRMCLTYLEDVIVFFKLRANHVNDLRVVLDRVRAAKLKLKPVKSKLFFEQVLYLWHVITAAGMSPDLANLRGFVDWRVPTSVRELQSFLNLVYCYCDFIDELTALTASLDDLTTACKGTQPVRFLAKHAKKLNIIKRRLCAAPKIAYSNFEAPFTLYINSSKIAVSAVLLQSYANGVERAVSFFSKKLSPAQRQLNYLRARVSRCCVRALAFSSLFAGALLSFSNRPSQAAVAPFKRAKGLGAHLRLARHADGVPDADQVRAWLLDRDCRRALPLGLSRARC